MRQQQQIIQMTLYNLFQLNRWSYQHCPTISLYHKMTMTMLHAVIYRTVGDVCSTVDLRAHWSQWLYCGLVNAALAQRQQQAARQCCRNLMTKWGNLFPHISPPPINWRRYCLMLRHQTLNRFGTVPACDRQTGGRTDIQTNGQTDTWRQHIPR